MGREDGVERSDGVIRSGEDGVERGTIRGQGLAYITYSYKFIGTG